MLNHTRHASTPRRVRSAHRNAGFTLVELMVGLVVGLIVIGGVISLYLTVVQGSAYTTREARLTQETRITMDFISADIRRAGFSHPERIIVPADEERLPINWFMEDDRWLSIHDYDGGTANCILVTYDPTFLYDVTTADFDDPPPAQYVFGYRSNNGTVEMLTGGLSGTTDCDAGTWEPLTDPDTTRVSELSFEASGSSCMKVDVDGETHGPVYGDTPCASLGSDDGDVFAESARVTVTLEAKHANDDATRVNHSDTVSVRNLRIFD